MEKPSGETMNLVYNMFKKMTIEQIKQCKSMAAQMGKDLFIKTYRAQCDYAINKKESGEWR
jgi:hypothetical protein